MTFWIHAPNVHQGGGRALIVPLLKALQMRPDWRCIIDSRLEVPVDMPAERVDRRVAPKPLDRLRAEWRLRAAVRPGDVVLCFGNLPPLFPVAGRVAVFIQNRYLLEPLETRAFSSKSRMRIAVERRWLRARARAAERIIVQTPSMQAIVRRSLGMEATIWPFVDAPAADAERRPVADRRYDFLYVATPEAHKNHAALLDAWRLLAERGNLPSLCLTLNRASAPVLIGRIDQLKSRHGVRIDCIEPVPPEAMPALYKSAGALVFPSLSESFGLPLVEARAYGLAIVAAERDYVRDVVEPDQTFDPGSALSIARAVERHLGVASAPPPIMTAREFIDRVTGRD